MLKKENFIQIFFILSICFQLIFYNLPEELRYSSFLLSLLFIALFWLQNRPLLIPKKLGLFFLLFLFANIFSAFFSPTKYQSLIEITKQTGLFLLVIAGVNLFQNKKVFQNLLRIIFLVVAFLAVRGIVEYTGRLHSQKALPLSEPFHWPSLAASFFLLVFPISLFFFLAEKKRGLRKLLFFMTTYFIGSAWILSKNYLALMPVTTLIVVLTLFKQKLIIWRWPVLREKLGEVFLLLALMATTLVNFFPSYGRRPASREVGLFQNKIIFQNKDDAWRFSKESIAKHFWQGIGPGNFGPVYRYSQNDSQPWSDFASNELLQTFVETGVFGFVAQLLIFIYFAFVCFKKIVISFRRGENYNSTIAASLFLFLLINFRDFSWRILPIGIIDYFLMAWLIKTEDALIVKTKLAYWLFLPMLLTVLVIFSDSLLLMIGQKYYWKGNYSQSERVISKLYQRPKVLLNPKALFSLAIIEDKKGETQKALTFFGLAKAIDPFNQEIDHQMTQINPK